MASNKANYAAIGLTVVLGVVATVGTLVYLGGVGESETPFYAETYTSESVSGLSVGSVVNFRGVKVGEVKEIDFVSNKYSTSTPGSSRADFQRVYILMAFPRAQLGKREAMVADMVGHGLRATLTASGITGLSRIELNIAKDAPPAETPPWRPEHLYIPSAPSLMANFSDSAAKLMSGINSIDVASVCSNASAAVRSAAMAANGIRAMVDSLKCGVDGVAESVSDAADYLRDLARELRSNPSLLVRERRAAPLEETE